MVKLIVVLGLVVTFLFSCGAVIDHWFAKRGKLDRVRQLLNKWDGPLESLWKLRWIRRATNVGLRAVGWFYPNAANGKSQPAGIGSGLVQSTTRRIFRSVGPISVARVCIISFILSSCAVFGALLEGASLADIFSSSEVVLVFVWGYVINLICDSCTIVVTWRCLTRVCGDAESTENQDKEVPLGRLGWVFVDLAIAVVLSVACLFFFDLVAMPRDRHGAFVEWGTTMLGAVRGVVRLQEDASWMRAIYASTTLLPTLFYVIVALVLGFAKLLIVYARVATDNGPRPLDTKPPPPDIRPPPPDTAYVLGPCKLVAVLASILIIFVAIVLNILF